MKTKFQTLTKLVNTGKLEAIVNHFYLFNNYSRKRNEHCGIIPETKSGGLFDNIH